MRWGLAAVLLVGCSFTPETAGAPGDDNATPPDGPSDGPPDTAPVDSPPDGPILATCPGYQPIANGFPTGATYKGVSTRMLWPEARQACQADGGDLVVVDGDAEGAAIIQLAADPGVGNENSPFLWVGLRDDPNTGTDNDFRTVRGGVAEFTPWGPGQPNGGTQDCVLIADDNTHDVFDYFCNAPQVFVCECLP